MNNNNSGPRSVVGRIPTHDHISRVMKKQNCRSRCRSHENIKQRITKQNKTKSKQRDFLTTIPIPNACKNYLAFFISRKSQLYVLVFFAEDLRKYQVFQ